MELGQLNGKVNVGKCTMGIDILSPLCKNPIVLAVVVVFAKYYFLKQKKIHAVYIELDANASMRFF